VALVDQGDQTANDATPDVAAQILHAVLEG
jgi:hypothetical protein